MESNLHLITNVGINYRTLWTELGILDAANGNTDVHE